MIIVGGGQAGADSKKIYIIRSREVTPITVYMNKADSSVMYSNPLLTSLYNGTAYYPESWEDFSTPDIDNFADTHVGYIFNSSAYTGRILESELSVYWMEPITCYKEYQIVNGVAERTTGRGFLYDTTNSSFVKVNTPKTNTLRYATNPLLTGKILSTINLNSSRKYKSFNENPEGSWEYYSGTWYTYCDNIEDFMLDAPDLYRLTIYTYDIEVSGREL